ncbi:SC35-like splicing factor 30A [Actinidia rufa]|uniref:SC35-like splicing factor 30A n=1 Tax=Actinidia rufa TaxID=165716 RepID=A0A7J0FMP7_9ERIC|nr:SC35-like splicing factor 30A [Actinidia rufa]
MRGRSYSYSPSPPRGGYSRRRRSPSPRGRYGGRGRDLPTSLLVRNLRHDCRVGGNPAKVPSKLGLEGNFAFPIATSEYPKEEQLHEIYEKLLQERFNGHLLATRLLYRGATGLWFFVQYVDPADAEEAKYHMDGQILLGRELTVVFAEENRKKPVEMRARQRLRSISPHGRKHRERSYSRSAYGSRSPSQSPIRSRSPEGYSR